MTKVKEWVCLVHGYKALPVCGLCISKPDPEREAMDAIVEDYRRLLDLASDVDVEIMRGYLSTLDRVRDRARGK